eukprot:8502721-Prorocentrum_lima.AAC.1
MTSSLVGSEMCIRDRQQKQGEAWCGCGPTKNGKHTPRRVQPACQAQEPVSYTHLTLPTICSV